MPFLEWRKFTFFDLKKNVDEGKISSHLKDVEITTTTSGNNQLIFGTANGQIHLISRSWDVTTFKAYELRVLLAEQLRNHPLLVTIGEDELGVNPVLKVWNIDRFEKTDAPFCCRITRTIPNNKPVQVTTLCVHENLQLLAVGFVDGTVLLYRGDITRDKGSRPKLLGNGGSPINGLAFKSMASSVLLFVASESSVYVYNITHKDKEQKLKLDNIGCVKGCSVLAESVQESQFVIASNNAIYFYTSDGKGPCYAVDGEKVFLEWFRSYLVIISKTNRVPTIQANGESASQPHPHVITVLDIHNKFTIFYESINEVKAIFSEWGAFYILDLEYNIYRIDEKDLQTKLSLLFKKNLYDFAIRIAKSEQYDTDGLVDIFQQYGDHLYSKGAHTSAIEQYIKTIGKLEPSYVIRKFVDSQHVELLTTYLQAIHKQGQANEDHTTLLLNCFTKLNKNSSLKEFILMKDKDLDFNVDIAIKACRQDNQEEALMLAKKYKMYNWYIKLQIEDHKNYIEALEYIADLEFKDAEYYMKKYGSILLQHIPQESTLVLKVLCSDYRPRTALKPDLKEISQKADPEDYIHLFLNNSGQLVEFLEYLIHEECFLSSVVYDTLLEHYLIVWSGINNDDPDKSKYAQCAMKLLQSSDETKYNKAQALIVCHMHEFSEGVLHLYEEQKLYQHILRYHISCQDPNAMLSCCRRYGQQERLLWVQAFFSCIKNPIAPPIDILSEILTVITKEKLLSAQFVIDAIGTGRSKITLAHVSSYIISEFKKEQDVVDNDFELMNSYRKDIQKLRDQLDTLKNGTLVIQASRCAACNHSLELPSLHFLCQHSYHQQCFQSYSENENECPACQPENKKLQELLKAREYTRDLNETFHSELEKRSDGFSLAAEYFGRGVFNKVKVITDPAIDKTFSMYDIKEQIKNPIPVISQFPMYGVKTEAKMRQIENLKAGPTVVPISEGRLRVQENKQSSLSVERAVSRYGFQLQQRPEKNITHNPFEDYDDSKNPFYEDDEDKNPFSENYDKNLNPNA